MTITICGSMQFHREMVEVKKLLESMRHSVYIPKNADAFEKTEAFVETDEERITLKVEYDLIREHFQLINKSDAILVLNYEKKGIADYIGGNTFLEMGIAFWHGKKIFLLNPIPDMDYKTEMHAMQPTILNGDLTKINKS